MGRRTIVIETRGDICMSDRDNPRSLVEIMNDVLSTVREHYDSEYVYYIEKEYEDIDVIYEWCAKHVPWQRDKIKMLPKDQRPRWMEQEITDTTEDSYSVFRRLDENTVAILAAVGVHRGGCEVDLLRSVLAYLPEAITLQKLQKQQEYLSYHDKLTGLYNRNSFVSYTTDINPDELNSLGAVSVDINGLKNFNKEFGRDYGDEVVIRVGEVLEEYFHTANVYRMTGDEYLVLVENITYEEFMKQVHGTYTKLDNISLGLASLGCAWEKIDIDVDALVLSAENMMREEKKKYYKNLRKGHHEPIIKQDLLEDLADLCGESVTLKVRRGKETIPLSLTPVKDEKGNYKLGIWVRDDTQGIGTLTYVDENGGFGALGHGISDVDTGELLSIADGNLYNAQILGIQKGEKGNPGELSGLIRYEADNILGEISENSKNGIFGTVDADQVKNLDLKKIPVGYKQDLKIGPASVLCCTDGEVKEYAAEITRIDMNHEDSNKSFVIQITDKELLEKTGGIVQGMSGSPVLQNGKLFGAVTHVFVQDSTGGYGIFIENMTGNA